jgi:hypothetical protein
MKYSIASSKGHNARDDHIKTKTWERGSSFGNAQARAFAKQSVLSVIEKRCEKQLCQVESVLSGIVSDLSKIGLDECEVLSHDTKKDVCTVMSMVTNANLAIKGLEKNAFNKRSASILTGFCAIMLPVGNNEEEDDQVSASIRHFSKLFGLRRQAKYIKLGIENRKAFNSYLQCVGPLVVGERVSCVGSDDATIIGIGDDGSFAIQLHPFESVVKYKTSVQGRVLR